MKKSILLAALLATGAVAAGAATDSSVIKLATSHSSMEVSLWGARILSLKIRGDEVLWRPREWRLEGGNGWAHGGIPLKDVTPMGMFDDLGFGSDAILNWLEYFMPDIGAEAIRKRPSVRGLQS